LGAKVVEVHVTFDRRMFGYDAQASLTIDELQQLVEGLRFTEKIYSNPVDKDSAAAEMTEMRQMFGKSLVAKQTLSKGTVLKATDVACKKPGKGIPAAKIDQFIGKKLKIDVTTDHFFTQEDFYEE